MSLLDIYHDVSVGSEEDKPKLFRMLDEHIDWDAIIPARFYTAFFQRIGRPREYPIEEIYKEYSVAKNFWIYRQQPSPRHTSPQQETARFQ